MPSTPVHGIPLDKKLPLLMAVVLLVVLMTAVLVVNRETRRAAQLVATHKVNETAENIALLLSQTPGRLADGLKALSHDTVLFNVLRARKPSSRDIGAVEAKLA